MQIRLKVANLSFHLVLVECIFNNVLFLYHYVLQ